MAHLEIEIKSLLGSKSAADALLAKMQTIDSACVSTSNNTQLNHYFEGGEITALFEATKHFFTPEQLQKFEKIVAQGTDFSIRTRQRDSEVLLVIKASIDEGTSANTISRLEFEEAVPVTLGALDEIFLGLGYTYQAKWSRRRDEYLYKGITVCFDKNAGYGYLAEFEKVVPNGSDVATTRAKLGVVMAELGVPELSQERLARMFAYYNANWADYYGTDKTFTIE